MRNIFFVSLLLSVFINVSAKQDIKCEPANWYAGMKDPSLQIMLSGKDIRAADVSVNGDAVTIDSIVRPDSPNYLFVYLNTRNAQPGKVQLKVGDETIVYPILKREKAGEDRKGFTNEDVLYMFMPDRFAQGHKDNSKVKCAYPYTINRKQPSLRHGGDIEGVRKHLDYFTDLGVTALWLAPVLENDMPEAQGQSSYHGYATTDYYKVDPRFGTNAEYRKMIDEAHQKGLKVVMDMIFNHCGSAHPWVKDAPFKDWFNEPNYGLQTSYKLTPTVDPYASSFDLKETVDGWFVSSMPDLNQRNPHLMRYLIQNSIWWIEEMGIDGIRMDTYPYADAKGMSSWMGRLNKEYPHFNVVGESWVTEPGFTSALQANSQVPINLLTEDNKVTQMKENGKAVSTNLTTVMDFTFYDRLNQAKNEETDAWWEGMNRIYGAFVYDFLYPNPKNVLAFLDNHDTDRFLGETQDSLMLKQGLALLLTINRIPQIYYGTEIMMNGVKTVSDGYVREDFPGGFPGDKQNAFTATGRTKDQNAMYNWVKKVLHWRQGNKVVTEGKMTQFIPWKGVYVITKEYEGKHMMVVLNGTSHQKTFEAARYKEAIPAGTKAKEITSGHVYDVCKDIKLPTRKTLILEY